MAWADPNNINTANLDANTDSPTLARADIKTAFDEVRSMANNSKVSWTPRYDLTAGTFTFTYNTQTGNYIEMGDIVFFEFHIDADVLVSDADAFNATARIRGFPVNPSVTIHPVHIEIQEAENWTGVTPNEVRVAINLVPSLSNPGGNGTLYGGTGGNTLVTGANMSSGVTVNNVSVKAKGWYLK